MGVGGGGGGDVLPLVLALPTFHGVFGGGCLLMVLTIAILGMVLWVALGTLLYIELPLSIRVLRGVCYVSSLV